MSQLDAELFEFIRRLNLQDDRIALAGQRAAALAEGIRDFAADGLAGGGVCLTTISGSIVGAPGVAQPLPGSTVQIIGHTSGTNYGTFVASDGTFSVGLVLATADTSIDLVATGPGARFAAGSPVNRSITRCSSNALSNITATPASNYVYLSNSGLRGCNFPISKDLLVTEPLRVGTGVLITNWPASGLACSNQTSNATFSCAPTTCGFYAGFNIANAPALFYPTLSPLGGCPDARLCGTGWSALTPVLPGGGSSPYTCPDVTTKFSLTHTVTIPANHLWYPAGPLTITYEEP